jgi:hypothetical protein
MDGSAEGRLSLRAICKEGSTSLQTLSAFSFVLRVSLVDANSPPLPPAPPPRRQIEEYDAGTSVRLGTVICWEAAEWGSWSRWPDSRGQLP